MKSTDKQIKSNWTKIIIGLVILFICLAGGYFYVIQNAHNRVAAFLQKSGFTYETLSTKWNGNFSATQVKINLDNNSLVEIENVDGKLAWFGDQNANMKWNNLHHQFMLFDITIPTVYINNAHFKLENNNKFSFDKMDIESIRIPKSVVSTKLNGTTQNVTYNEIILSKINNENVANISIDHAGYNIFYEDKLKQQTGFNSITATNGPSTIENLNINQLTKYYTTTSDATDDTNPYRKIYDRWNINNIKFDLNFTDNTTTTINIGEYLSLNATARIPSANLLDLNMRISKMLDIDHSASPESIKTNLMELRNSGLAYLANLSSIGSFDLSFKNVNINTQKNNIDIGQFQLAYQNGKFNYGMSNVVANIDRDVVSFHKIMLSDFKFPKLMSTIRNGLDLFMQNTITDRDKLKFYNDMSFAFVPHFQHFELNGFDLKEYDHKEKDLSPKTSIKSIIIDADFTKGAIPTSISATITDCQCPIVNKKQRLNIIFPTYDEILDSLGYSSMNFDATINAAWSADTQELKINEISYNAKDMGNFKISGDLKNVNEALFSDDLIMMGASAAGINIQSLNIEMNIDDIVKHISAVKTEFLAMRHQFAMQVRLMSAIYLDASISEQIGVSLEKFIENGGTISVQAKAKTDKGIGLLDFIIAQSNPLFLLNKIDLSAQIKQ